MSKYLFIVTVCAIVISCSPSKNKVLELDKEEEAKIIELLADMHYVKEASKLNRKLNMDSVLNVYKAQMFEIHGIDQAQFDKIKTYLESDLDNYYRIEQKVHRYMKDIKDTDTKSPKEDKGTEPKKGN